MIYAGSAGIAKAKEVKFNLHQPEKGEFKRFNKLQIRTKFKVKKYKQNETKRKQKNKRKRKRKTTHTWLSCASFDLTELLVV